MKALVDWFVYDFDREELEDRCRKYGGLVAGAFFGAGAWFHMWLARNMDVMYRLIHSVQ